MNPHVNAIAGRLSLRPPQRRSLEILDRITDVVPPRRGTDVQAALDTIRSEFPAVTNFEREFVSLCFALATGVGKTRLMGAFISYLHLAHGIDNFFVLAPNLTIYNKLIADFTPNTSKYVFTGISDFAVNPPMIITGDNYDQRDPASGLLFGGVRINIFNISKINSEVRGGKAPRIKRLSEYIGQSYFDYLAGLSDLVLIMDESHRYRASAGVRAINELKPILGLELTATPFVEGAKGAIPFENVIYDYPLGKAMSDGFVKEPAVVTQKNFDPSQFSAERLEQIKLEDGIRLHESVKVELETYARQSERPIVKPFVLVIARDTTHAGQLLQLIQSDKFFDGRYRDKVIQVDSSRSGAEEDEMVQRLLAVEKPEEPTEIVIHVNMLKEGWDVTNLYTIVPLRAANARILIEQSIGRGLRLPYGLKTGVTAVDRLNIVAHDRFQEIIDEASRPGSVIQLQQLILDPSTDLQKTVTIVAQPNLLHQIGSPVEAGAAAVPVTGAPEPIFKTAMEQKIANLTYEAIRKYEALPNSAGLLEPEVQRLLIAEVRASYTPVQQELPGVTVTPDFGAIISKTTKLMVQQTIDIPRILVVPKGEVTTGFKRFTLSLAGVNYQPVARDLLIQHLRTHQQDTLSVTSTHYREQRLEDYIVRALMDFDDISYDEHADLLYDLAGQVVAHLRMYLSVDEARNVLQYYERQIAEFVHAQMQPHYWEKVSDYEIKVSAGFSRLKQSAFTTVATDKIRDFRQSVDDKGRIGQMVFGGFKHCLYPVQKFQSDSERKLAIILDREALKWFKPVIGQFRISYKVGHRVADYQPDFVAETADRIYMLEPKARNELEADDVRAKKASAERWCELATTHSTDNAGKPWEYILIPHDVVAENLSIAALRNHRAI